MNASILLILREQAIFTTGELAAVLKKWGLPLNMPLAAKDYKNYLDNYMRIQNLVYNMGRLVNVLHLKQKGLIFTNRLSPIILIR